MAALAAVCFCAAAAGAQNIDYLPRNEELETVSATADLVLGELKGCPVEPTLIEARLCQECLLLKTGCPDCCLVSPSPSKKFEAIKCAPADDPYGTDPAMSCLARFRFDAACPQAAFTSKDMGIFTNLKNYNIPQAQRRGCPGLTAKKGSNPIVPAFMGCGPYVSSYEGDFFHPPDPSWKPAPPTDEYKDFVAACTSDADSRELCSKAQDICQSKVCAPAAGGYAANCIDANCKTRVASWERAGRTVTTAEGSALECWAVKSTHCLDLNMKARACLAGITTNECASCFKRIYPDDSFKYQFVPRSGQKLVFIWKLFVTSVGDQSQNSNFYSKVQVEDHMGNPVYSSPVHQKVFEGSFSVFSAISVPDGILKTGDEYFLRLYYFIGNDPSLDLRMRVSGAEITAVKVRE